METVMKTLLGNYYDETGMFLTVIAAGKAEKSAQSNAAMWNVGAIITLPPGALALVQGAVT